MIKNVILLFLIVRIEYVYGFFKDIFLGLYFVEINKKYEL